MASDDLFYVDVIGDRNALRNLDQMPDTVRAILLAKTKGWVEETQDKVINNILERFNSSSGRLANSVKTMVTEADGRVEGRVYFQDVPYARAQEEGATTPPHVIRPKNGKILAFTAASGDKVFATYVFHPGGQIPAKHFVKDAYREIGPMISRGIKTAIVQGIRAKMRSGS